MTNLNLNFHAIVVVDVLVALWKRFICVFYQHFFKRLNFFEQWIGNDLTLKIYICIIGLFWIYLFTSISTYAPVIIAAAIGSSHWWGSRKGLGQRCY